MKTKNMTTIWVSIGIIACLFSFWIGKHYSSFAPETVAEMDSFVSQMKPLLADNEARTKEELSLLMEILKALDAGEDSRAKAEIIERLGRFYYNYTYENERHMNSESTEMLLKSMEGLGVSSGSFLKVVQFRPEE